MTSNIEIVVYYISPKKLCVQELKQYYKLLPGFIEVIFHESMTIIDLRSANPGNGNGTHLIVHACKEAIKRGISTVTLDDCSDMYRNNRNIYTNVGMEYKNKDGGPEMIGNVKNIAEYKTMSVHPVIYSCVL